MISDSLDIVIPVFNAVEDTIECVESILQSDAADCSILLLNDASYSGTEERLKERFAPHVNVVVVSHCRNRGYTKNISYGIKKSKKEYVCILNSDTLVPGLWARKLLAHLQDMPVFAAVGPLSNAASFQSIPQVYAPNKEFSVNDQLGGFLGELNFVNSVLDFFGPGKIADVPILNGFCTVFRRSALEEIGGFDDVNFKTGYGEENDLCIRLKQHSYRLGVALDCFVHHKKSKSFGADVRKKLAQKGSETLKQKYSSDYMAGLSSLLGQQPQLEVVRLLAEAALFDDQGEKVERSAYQQKKLDFSEGDTFDFSMEPGVTAINISGPLSCSITKSKIQKLPTFEVPGFTFGYQPHTGLVAHIPSGKTLRLFSHKPMLTALLSFAYASHEEGVYLSGWEHTPEIERSLISRIPFGHLYGAICPDSSPTVRPIIGVACSRDEDQRTAQASVYIRTWERTLNSNDRAHSFARISPMTLLQYISRGIVKHAILQRANTHPIIWAELKNYVLAGKLKYLYEIDDDLLNVPALVDIKNEYESYRETLYDIIRHASVVTVASQGLLSKIRKINSNTVLIPNALSHRLWGGDVPKRTPDGLFRCLYMGSRTHDRDIDLILPALEAIAGAHPNFRLALVGGMHPDRLSFLPDWVEVAGGYSANYPEFVGWLKKQACSFDCGIAPLVEDEFTRSKSSLKILDYAGLGLPVIASSGQVYGGMAKNAPAVTLAQNTPEAWESAILAFMNDSDLAHKGGLMREWVLKHHILENTLKDYDALLSKYLIGSYKKNTAKGKAIPLSPNSKAVLPALEGDSAPSGFVSQGDDKTKLAPDSDSNAPCRDTAFNREPKAEITERPGKQTRGASGTGTSDTKGLTGAVKSLLKRTFNL